MVIGGQHRRIRIFLQRISRPNRINRSQQRGGHGKIAEECSHPRPLRGLAAGSYIHLKNHHRGITAAPQTPGGEVDEPDERQENAVASRGADDEVRPVIGTRGCSTEET